MKISTELIENELAALERSEAIAAPYYLNQELKRRRAVKRNAGRPVANDTEQHRKWREASARYRAK